MSASSWLLLAPLALLLAAAHAWRRPGRRPAGVPASARAAAAAAMGVAFTAAVLLALEGPSTSALIGVAGVGLSFRLDPVSVAMLGLVSFIGWVVIRFSINYLDGEAWQGRFIAWLCATLATVMLLVTAGNLVQLLVAWVAMSAASQRLLRFYAQRPAAQHAARRMAACVRLGDVALAVAVATLVFVHRDTDIETILSTDHGGAAAMVVAVALAAAAVLKSAQIPVHGWLTQVMEAPTPVSALLHAGVINAGGFLLIRLADLLLAAPSVMLGLVVIGALTAGFGAVVMLAQPAVKTGLAWSTVAQMGFMIMQCGFGLFALALLHIVAHSLVKARSFLGSGQAIEEVVAARRVGPVAAPGVAATLLGITIAVGLYLALAALPAFGGRSVQEIGLGAVLGLGMSYLFSQGLAGQAPFALMLHTACRALAAIVAYFGLHALARFATAGTLPPVPAADAAVIALLVVVVVFFAALAFAQSTLPRWAGHPRALALRVHLAGGLYLDAWAARVRSRLRGPGHPA